MMLCSSDIQKYKQLTEIIKYEDFKIYYNNLLFKHHLS